MACDPRFGPAGIPPLFKILGAELADVPQLLREEGLNALEYQAVRWGKAPQLKCEDAKKLGVEAKKNDVLLSIHGSYYVNLCGKKEVVEASKKRLIAGATAAQWMGAYILVFHLGFYGHMEKSCAFRSCVESLKDVVATLNGMGLKEVKLGPETMGRVFQVGTLDEILAICEEVEQTQPVIDWAHLHARQKGQFRKTEDFCAVIEEVEDRLGMEAVRNMHCHFSRIEYTAKGERRHHALDEKRYGPEFEMLAEVIANFKMQPVVICETPLLDVDAMKMRATFQRILEKNGDSAKP